jgi:DNA-binding response OmpR family regulator
MLSLLLTLSQIETKAVATADQALRLMRAERFDLYLLDARLPDLDGFELCRRMRIFDRHTPILFFSGAAYEADKKRGIDAGANAYLTKPDVEELLASITQFIFPENNTADIIPLGRKTSFSSTFDFEPAAA